jgi:ferritin-like metal-binding protein YciE
MQAETLSDLFERGLEFAWDCEHQLVRDLPRLADAAHSDELRASFLRHLIETKEQILRLERIFTMLNRAPASETCEPVRTIASEAAKLIQHIEPSSLRDAALIFNANQIEHYEIALYGSLLAFARTLGTHEAADLLDITLTEEKVADHNLTSLAENAVNQEAANFRNAAPFAFI